jgi:hypothetical protein
MINTDTKYYQYVCCPVLLICLCLYYAIIQHFSDCDGSAIFGISSKKVAIFLSKSDAIWLVSDQFKVLIYAGGGPLLTVLGVVSEIYNEPKCSLIYSVDRSSTSSTRSTSSTIVVVLEGQEVRG